MSIRSGLGLIACLAAVAFASPASAQYPPLWNPSGAPGFSPGWELNWEAQSAEASVEALAQAGYAWCKTTPYYESPGRDCQPAPYSPQDPRAIIVLSVGPSGGIPAHYEVIVSMTVETDRLAEVRASWYVGHNEADDCPPGQAIAPQGYDCIPKDHYLAPIQQDNPDPCNNPTNPCDPANGNKFQAEVDVAPQGIGMPSFTRYYNSMGAYRTADYMGVGWRHTYSRSLDEAPEKRPPQVFAVPSHQSASYTTESAACHDGWNDIKSSIWGGDHLVATATYVGGNVCKIQEGGKVVALVPVRARHIWRHYTAPPSVKTVTRPNGSSIVFEHIGGTWTSPTNSKVSLVESGADWIYTDEVGNKETFDSEGRLTSIEYRSGITETLSYDATTGRLKDVRGPFGHKILFGYNNDRLSYIRFEGRRINYWYNSSGALTTVELHDTQNKYRRYHYEDLDLPFHLTGITDRNGDRYATWAYDTSGRAVLSKHGADKERVELAYNTNGTTTLTMGNGATISYDYSMQAGTRKLDDLTGDVCGQCPGGDIKSRTYDTNGYLYDATDWEGNTTRTIRNSEGRTTTRVDGLGSPAERTTTTTWHSTLPLPTQIATPLVTTDFTYDASGNATTISRTDGMSTRVWTMTYDSYGRVLTIDGPRTDVSDVTTFEYRVCTIATYCGQLYKVTNALGHVTATVSYNTYGLVSSVQDESLGAIEYQYNTRRLVSRIGVRSSWGWNRRWTDFTYTDADQIETVTMPDGLVLTYTYDDAHYLTRVTDNLGNRIDYSHDSMGNVSGEKVYDPLGVLTRSMDYVYDLNNRLSLATAAGSFNTSYLFDDVGNLETLTDADLEVTQNAYDVLNRLTQTTDAMLGLTIFGYDDHVNLTSVTAPNNAATTYEYNAFDDRTKEISADRGTIIYTHDAAGNVLTKTDARGKVTTYTYDALNRVTEEQLDNLDTITYEYDTGYYLKGKLTRITDPSGTTEWTYNNFGEVASKIQTIGTTVLTTAYGYDGAGRLTTITLPSGKVVTYGYNTYQATSVTVDSTPVLSAAGYEPFGPVNGWTWGDASASSWTFDLRGLPTSHSLAGDTRTLGYDNVGQIVTLDDTRHDLDFDYDALGRLFDFDALGLAPLTAQDFSYDANGNRLSFTEGTSYPYTVTPSTNRVATVAGPIPKTYSYDAAGSITSDGGTTYTYDDRGRLVTAGTASYTYNGLGQRVKKDNGTVTLFAYDEAGNLIGEYDAAGNPIREHVWFEGAPVAVIVGPDVHYVHTDHLGTPRAITDAGTVIWRWESDPFGSTAAQEDPDGDLVAFTYNLRFPGQYYDSESGLHYNYFRTYDPRTGRYLESDPIGLLGGRNTFSYGLANPLKYDDPLGLFPPEAYAELLNTARQNLTEDEYQEFCEDVAVASTGGVLATALLLMGPREVAQTVVEEVTGIPTGVPKAADLLKSTEHIARRVARGKSAFDRAVKELGLDRKTASQNLHSIKRASGRGGADDVHIDLDTGDVIAPESGDVIGNLHDG